jgi:hypothetical protein
MVDYDKEVDTDITYTFKVTERTSDITGVTTQILEWLHDNLEDLRDDLNKQIFGKVNYGFNDDNIKTFGRKPVCDVYLNKVEYDGNFEDHIPIKVNTFLIFYLKGANNHTYLKACELHDYLVSVLSNTESFKRLDNVVRDTYITNTEVRNQKIRGGYGVLGAFELTHTLY